MQTDLHLLLLIIGVVFGIFVIFNTFKQRRLKLHAHIKENFEQVLCDTTQARLSNKENPLQVGECDPLLEDSLHNETAFQNIGAFSEEAMVSTPHFRKNTSVRTSDKAGSAADHKKEKKLDYVVFTILPKQSIGFSGNLLLSAFRATQFHYGKSKLFHQYKDNNPAQTVLFSVASIQEPGTFDYNKMSKENYAGIMLWINFNHPEQNEVQFESFLACAKQLAFTLNGVLSDVDRCPITVQTIAHYRSLLRGAEVDTIQEK